MDTVYLYLNCGCVGDIPMISFLSDRTGRCDVQAAETQGVRDLPNENGERQYGVQALGYPHSRLSWRAPVRSIQSQGYPCSQAPLMSTSMEHKPWASLIPGSTDEHQYGVQALG